MTDASDPFAGTTTDAERLAIEATLLTVTDNTARPDDGPQPVAETN